MNKTMVIAFCMHQQLRYHRRVSLGDPGPAARGDEQKATFIQESEMGVHLPPVRQACRHCETEFTATIFHSLSRESKLIVCGSTTDLYLPCALFGAHPLVFCKRPIRRSSAIAPAHYTEDCPMRTPKDWGQPCSHPACAP